MNKTFDTDSNTLIKEINGKIRDCAKQIQPPQLLNYSVIENVLSLEEIKEIVRKAQEIYDNQTTSSLSSNLPLRNTQTHNQMLSVLINAFAAQLKYHKSETTLKEKKDYMKKYNQQNFLQKIDYLVQAFDVIFQNIKRTKGIHPDQFTVSQLLRGLKILAHSQLINLQNPQQIQIAQVYLQQVGAHLRHLVNKLNQHLDIIILNSFMDLCVRYSLADKAIQIYNEACNKQKFSTFDDQESQLELTEFKIDSEEADKQDHNLSIQMGILIKAYGQLGDMEMAFDIFKGNQLQAKKPIVNNDITFGCLIDACVRNGHIQKAEEIFSEILTQNQNDQNVGIKPNTIIYTTMIKAYSRTFNLARATQIYDIMIQPPKVGQPNCEPNIITFNSIIDCCVRCGDMAKATQIFEYMKVKSMANAFDSQFGQNRNVKPDLITFSTLIKGHCRVKNIERALILHEEMLDQGIKADEVLYNSLLDGCLKANQTDMALKCYQNMKKLRIKASNVTYSILAKIYQRKGQIDKALGILDEMKAEGVKPGVFVFTCMIQTCIQAGMIDQAIEMFKKMVQENIQPDNVTYYTIIQGCLVQNQQGYALDLLIEAIHKSQAHQNLKKHHLQQFKFQFSAQQKQTLYHLLKNLMIDENNFTALKRYNDLNFVLSYFESTNPFFQGSSKQWKSHQSEDKENKQSVMNIQQQLGNILLDVTNQPNQSPFTSSIKMSSPEFRPFNC